MNLRELEYWIALDEEKHFLKAAERCFVSQPTLSGQLRKLKGKNLLMLADGHCLREQAVGFCFAAGIGEDPRVKAPASRPCAIWSRPANPEEGGVSYRPVVDPVPGRTISLLALSPSLLYRHYSVRRPCFNELAARIARLIKPLLVDLS